MPAYDISALEFVKEGKVKKVYIVGNDMYLFDFTDKISVFDKTIPSLIPDKGKTLNRCSSYWFKHAEQMGIQTHFIEAPSPTQMLVKRAGSFPLKGPKDPDYSWVNTNRNNYQIPLEVIGRDYIVGSLFDRLLKGEVTPEQLGYPAGYDPKKIKKGEKLPQRFIEVTTKFEAYDRPVPIDEAYRIAGLMPAEYNEMTKIVSDMFDRMAAEVEPRGLIHMDGKMEFALGPHRELVLIDTFGTGDEDRFVLRKEYEESEGQQEYKIVEISKELVRQHYRKIGYHEQLELVRQMNKKKKADGFKPLPEPEIPALPEDMVQKTSETYLKLMEMITGEEA